MLELPSRVAEETSPMLVTGRVDGALAYLKVIPEALYAATGSIVLSDHIQQIEPAPPREQREESTQLSLTAFTTSSGEVRDRNSF